MNYNTFIHKNKKGFRTALFYSLFVTIGVGLGLEIGLSGFQDVVPWLLIYLSAFCFVFGVIVLTNYIIRRRQTKIFNQIRKVDAKPKSSKISFEYTREDYYKANFITTIQQGSWWFVFFFFTFIFLSIAVLSIIYRFDITYLFIMFFSLFFITFLFLGLKLRSNSLFKEQEQLHGKQEIEIIDGGSIKHSYTNGEEILKSAHHIYINNDFILIFNTPVTFCILPKRVFEDENQFILYAKIAIEFVGGET